MRAKIKQFNTICIFVVFTILTFYSSMAFSAVPQFINYQGSLSDAGGNPVNATLNITFTLYDVDAGPGTILWQEVQSVTITNGQFSAQLGADGNNPLDIALFEDPLYLGLTVGGDAEMTPRQALTAVGYAVRAKTVESDTLNSLPCSADEIPKFNGSVWSCAVDTDTNTNAATICAPGTFLNGDGSCDAITDTNTTYSAGSGLSLNGTTFSIPTNGIDASHLATNSVGSSEITTNAVGKGEIAINAVGTSEVVDNSLTAFDLAPNSVGTSEVADNSLTENDLAANSVRTSEIAADAVGVSELSDLARGIGINGSIVIPASTFRTNSATMDFFLANVGYIRPGGVNTLLCIQTPVALPHGVTVTDFEISMLDNSVNNTGTFSLRRAGFGTATSTVMGSVATTGTSASVRVFADTTILNSLVNGFSYSYFIEGCFTSDGASPLNLLFYGARIRYN